MHTIVFRLWKQFSKTHKSLLRRSIIDNSVSNVLSWIYDLNLIKMDQWEGEIPNNRIRAADYSACSINIHYGCNELLPVINFAVIDSFNDILISTTPNIIYEFTNWCIRNAFHVWHYMALDYALQTYACSKLKRICNNTLDTLYLPEGWNSFLFVCSGLWYSGSSYALHFYLSFRSPWLTRTDCNSCSSFLLLTSLRNLFKSSFHQINIYKIARNRAKFNYIKLFIHNELLLPVSQYLTGTTPLLYKSHTVRENPARGQGKSFWFVRMASSQWIDMHACILA